MYVGSSTQFFEITAVMSLSSGNNNQIGSYIAVNGTVVDESEMYTTTNGSGRAENVVCKAIVELSTSDTISMFVENNTGTGDITVTQMTVTVKTLN